MRPLLFLCAAFAAASAIACAPAPSETPSVNADDAEVSALAAKVAAIVDPIIEVDLADNGTPGAAFVYVADGAIIYSKGYGVSDFEKKTPVDPARTLWPAASITKAVTAMAVLQLVAEGKVSLDENVNTYLKRIKVPSQGYGPLTLRHLLSHTGGLDELPGRQFDGSERQDMAAFMRDRIVRYRAPGVRTAYSTYGIMLAAVVLEDVTGERYADYVRDHIFRPAGMTSARIMETRGDEAGVATPYEIEDGRARAISYEWYVSTPTSSMVATVEDMGRLLLIHLADGRMNDVEILAPEMMALMHAQQATVHPALPGWSLGMQMDAVNGRRIAEHGGDIGGFSALFAVLPEEDAGFFIVGHGEGNDLRFRVKQALMDGLFPSMETPFIPAPRAENAEALKEYAGRYISSIECRSCPGAGDDAFIVEANADGTLSLWGQTWIPRGDDLFIRDDGKRLLGFARAPDGKIASVSGGSWRVADRLPEP
jgi:CubicO group peptidase (beta-lactamase class C family)